MNVQNSDAIRRRRMEDRGRVQREGGRSWVNNVSECCRLNLTLFLVCWQPHILILWSSSSSGSKPSPPTGQGPNSNSTCMSRACVTNSISSNWRVIPLLKISVLYFISNKQKCGFERELFNVCNVSSAEGT